MSFDQDQGVSIREFRLAKLTRAWFLTSTLVWLLSGCSSLHGGTTVYNSREQSLNLIRYAISQAAPRGVRSVSENQREYFSNYFSPAMGFDEDGTERRERAYAKFVVLGDSRPYQTVVYVYRETRSGREYSSNGQDKPKAKALAKRLEEILDKSRNDRNFIDDFRAF